MKKITTISFCCVKSWLANSSFRCLRRGKSFLSKNDFHTHNNCSVIMSIVGAALLCSACSGGASGIFGGQKKMSHGAGVAGYGPIKFGMSRDDAYRAVQNRGPLLEVIPGKNDEVLKYGDYMGYLAVRVDQYFAEDKKTKARKAAKADVHIIDAEKGPKSLGDCHAFNSTVYSMLHSRYGEPDWAPRIESRGAGESGVSVYTFADSSTITLTYDYTAGGASGLCSVKLAFAPGGSGGGGGGDD